MSCLQCIMLLSQCRCVDDGDIDEMLCDSLGGREALATAHQVLQLIAECHMSSPPLARCCGETA